MSKKDIYIYPAIFDYADDGISVEFPDLPGCLTSGDSDEEAFQMAREAMALHLYSMESDGDPIPSPSKVHDIKVKENQTVVLIEVFMPVYRYNIENKAVKKTLTIPKWLDELGKKHDVNYSQILQDALKQHLGSMTKDK